jgi:hypothetical protein
MFFVDMSKGGSRWVPVHHSLRRELNKYLYLTTNLALKRRVLGAFWKRAGLDTRNGSKWRRRN